MPARLYYNPRCSKSRAALALLREHGVEPEIRDYLRTPADVRELAGLLARLGCTPRELMRRKEAAYSDAGLDDPELSDEALLEALGRRPELLERPLLVVGERAVIARPPERVLELLDGAGAARA